MPTELDARLKTALDESRLLILGAQVLFGFTFQGTFQELFEQLSPTAKIKQCVALLLLTISIVFLIVPSLYHQIGCDSRSVHRALHVATRSAGASLLPLTLGLGASAFVVVERLAGFGLGTIIAIGLSAVGLGLLYGLGLALRKPARDLPPTKGDRSQDKNRTITNRSTRYHSRRASLAGVPVRCHPNKSFHGPATGGAGHSRLRSWFRGIVGSSADDASCPASPGLSRGGQCAVFSCRLVACDRCSATPSFGYFISLSGCSPQRAHGQGRGSNGSHPLWLDWWPGDLSGQFLRALFHQRQLRTLAACGGLITANGNALHLPLVP
jgi:uncharacterized protein DUF6328